MLKKIMSILLSAMIVTGTTLGGSIYSLAAGPAYVIDDPTGVTVGVPFTLDVEVEGNTGIISHYLQLSYDTSKLEITAIDTNKEVLAAFRNTYNTFSSPMQIAWGDMTASNDYVENGVAMTLYITPLAAGQAYVTVDCDDTQTGDVDFNPVDFGTKTVTFNIACDEHNFNDWAVDTPATCTEAATEIRVCTGCGAEVTRDGDPALGHNWVGKDADKHECSRKAECQVADAVHVFDPATGECTDCSYECVHVSDNAQADDCISPNTCENCGFVMLEGKIKHNAKVTNCEVITLCSDCGLPAIAAGDHTPDVLVSCTEARDCIVCGMEALPAGEHTSDNRLGDCENPEKCTVTGCSAQTGYIYPPGTHNIESDSNGEDGTHSCNNPGCTAVKEVTHTFTEWNAVSETVNCGETADTTSTCDFCSGTATRTGNMQDHVWGEYVPNGDATCTENGTETAPCTRGALCTESAENTREMPESALGHSEPTGVWTSGNAANCTTASTRVEKCARCDVNVAVEEAGALGHDFGEWEVVTAAKCEVAGSETRTCSLECELEGATETREIAALTHDWSEWEVTTPADCENDGVETRTCANGANCSVGEVPGTETNVIPATGHTWGLWSTEDDITADPETVPQFEYKRTCETCEETESKFIENIGCDHDFSGETEVLTPATCFEEGEANVFCANDCGVFITQAIEKTAHVFGEYTVTEGGAATCTEPGTKSAACTAEGCTATDTQTIAALGHDIPEAWTVTTAASCTDGGVESRTCTRNCELPGNTETRAIAALGHNFPETWTVRTAATVSAEGLEFRACIRTGCTEEETRAIAKLPDTGDSDDDDDDDDDNGGNNTGSGSDVIIYYDRGNTQTNDENDQADDLGVADDEDDIDDDSDYDSATIPHDIVVSALDEDDSYVVINEGESTVISADSLQEIKNRNSPIKFELPSGLVVTIDPATITSGAKEFDLDIKITATNKAATIDGKKVPANSIVITPNTKGAFGFEVSFDITAEQLAEAKLNGNNIKLFYINDDNEITDLGKVKLNDDGSVTIRIKSASSYLLSADTSAETVAVNPNTGAEITGFAAVVIAGSILVISRKRKIKK